MVIFLSQIVYCEDDFHSPTASTSPPASPSFHLRPRRRRKTSSGTRHKDEEGEITIECQRLNREHQLEKVGCTSLKIFLPNIDIIASLVPAVYPIIPSMSFYFQVAVSVSESVFLALAAKNPELLQNQPARMPSPPVIIGTIRVVVVVCCFSDHQP